MPCAEKVVVQYVPLRERPDFSQFGDRREKELVSCVCGCGRDFMTARNKNGQTVRKYYDADSCKMRYRRRKQNPVYMGPVLARDRTRI